MSVEDENSVLHFLPPDGYKAELHTRTYEPNPERISIEFGDCLLIFYKDSKKGFLLDRNQITVAHIDYWHLKKGFYGISSILKALKNENPKRNVVRTYKRAKKSREEIRKSMGDVMEKCL